MKRPLLYALLLLLPMALHAIDRVSIESKVIASSKKAIPHDLSKLPEGRYLNITRPPTATTRPGNAATVELVQEHKPATVPLSSIPAVPIGVTIRIEPFLRDNKIIFTGQITLSELVASKSSEKQSSSEVKSRVLYISGSVRSGEEFWFDFKETPEGKKTAVWMRLNHEEVPGE